MIKQNERKFKISIPIFIFIACQDLDVIQDQGLDPQFDIASYFAKQLNHSSFYNFVVKLICFSIITTIQLFLCFAQKLNKASVLPLLLIFHFEYILFSFSISSFTSRLFNRASLILFCFFFKVKDHLGPPGSNFFVFAKFISQSHYLNFLTLQIFQEFVLFMDFCYSCISSSNIRMLNKLQILIFLTGGMLNQQNQKNCKHTISCFDETLNGWLRQSPQKVHNRQASLLQQLQSNLIRYEDGSKKHWKQRQQNEVQQVRLPFLAQGKSNLNNNQIRKGNQHNLHKLQSEFNLKKALPLRMKTLTIHDIKENCLEEMKPTKKKFTYLNCDKQEFRKKVVINFQRIKQIGQNCLQFSDDRFFKDTINVQKKSKSLKLHMFPD